MQLLKIKVQKFGGRLKKHYLCKVLKNAPSKGTHFKRQTTSYTVSYGVMVAQQVLVLFVVVRIRLGQQKR